MSSSILDDVKHTLGILPEDDTFDTDIIMHINTTVGTLTQLGVGPAIGFQITDKDATWDMFFTDPRLNAAKSYIYLRVKMLHEPDLPGPALAAMERQCDMMEFRLNVVADYG